VLQEVCLSLNPRAQSVSARRFHRLHGPVLAVISLCHACACQEILRAETARGQVAVEFGRVKVGEVLRDLSVVRKTRHTCTHA
jgi:hypothetical protein